MKILNNTKLLCDEIYFHFEYIVNFDLYRNYEFKINNVLCEMICEKTMNNLLYDA